MKIKKNDLILAAVILAAALIAGIGFWAFKKPGARVVITVDGKEFGSYRLDEEQTIQIGSTNVLQIRDGQAKMIKADCPDKLCMHQKAISSSQESIICLPNKVVVTVEGTPGDSGSSENRGKGTEGLDSIAG